ELSSNALTLKSYSAVPVRNLQIRAKIRHSDDWVILADLDELTPFSTAKFNIKVNDQSRFPLAEGSGSIRMAGLSQTTLIQSDIFDLHVTSETDEHVKKLNKIQAKWKIYFGKYDEPGKWCRVTPVYAREWVIMMTNLAYMLSTPEFENVWFNHKAVMGHDFFGNAGQVDGPNGIYTPEDYVRIYKEILNRNEINLGITNMGGVLVAVPCWVSILGYSMVTIVYQVFVLLRMNSDIIGGGIIAHGRCHHMASNRWWIG